MSSSPLWTLRSAYLCQGRGCMVAVEGGRGGRSEEEEGSGFIVHFHHSILSFLPLSCPCFQLLDWFFKMIQWQLSTLCQCTGDTRECMLLAYIYIYIYVCVCVWNAKSMPMSPSVVSVTLHLALVHLSATSSAFSWLQNEVSTGVVDVCVVITTVVSSGRESRNTHNHSLHTHTHTHTHTPFTSFTHNLSLHSHTHTHTHARKHTVTTWRERSLGGGIRGPPPPVRRK